MDSPPTWQTVTMFRAAEFSMEKTKVNNKEAETQSIYCLLSRQNAPNLPTFVKTQALTFLYFALGMGNRYRMQQLQQKDWIEQQIREKQLMKD